MISGQTCEMPFLTPDTLGDRFRLTREPTYDDVSKKDWNAELGDFAILVGSSFDKSALKGPIYTEPLSPHCNLFNEDGLPASPFRTDDWPGITVKGGS